MEGRGAVGQGVCREGRGSLGLGVCSQEVCGQDWRSVRHGVCRVARGLWGRGFVTVLLLVVCMAGGL